MPEQHPENRHSCGHVIKRAFDYGLIEREDLETKGHHETFTMGRNVRLVRALPPHRFRLSRLRTVLRDQWRAEIEDLNCSREVVLNCHQATTS